MKLYRPSASGFTLIELLVGMVVFTIGLTGIFALLNTTLSSAHFSRDEIVVSGLLREQIDLIQNIRNTNIRSFLLWDSIPLQYDGSVRLGSGVYLVENAFQTGSVRFNPDYSIADSPVNIKKLSSLPASPKEIWDITQLRLDEQGRYRHSVDTGTGTLFASYIVISPLTVAGQEIQKDNKSQ